MKESNFLKKVQLLFSEKGFRLFRNNVGGCENHGRWVDYGVGGKGGSDLIGYQITEITPEMVGKKVAIFAAVELKTGKTGTSFEQKKFIEIINKHGGIGLILHENDID